MDYQNWNQQSNVYSSHPGWFCPDAYNGKSLLGCKPWKSPVSSIALPVSRTADSGTCSRQLYQHPANPSDVHMDHSGRWVMKALQEQEGECYEVCANISKLYRDSSWSVFASNCGTWVKMVNSGAFFLHHSVFFYILLQPMFSMCRPEDCASY